MTGWEKVAESPAGLPDKAKGKILRAPLPEHITYLDAQRKHGVEANSVATDPLFIDPKNGDFRFREDSPAPKLCIEPLVLKDAGVRPE